MKKKVFNPKDFGLKEGYLYEILATTFLGYKEDEVIKPNTSCIGIRLTEKDNVNIRLYANTITLKNLKANELITINFVNNVYLYALAALKDKDVTQGIIKFSNTYYNSLEIDIPAEENSESMRLFMPYINKGWGALFCKVLKENQITEKDKIGEAKISEFLLEVIHFNKIKESFKLFNRAENIALETIILATKLKAARENNKKELFDEIKNEILESIEKIERFGKNKRSLNAIRVVKNFLKTQNY
jgi:hypothetical protein